MRGIGVHVCEGCGAVYDTIGAYLDCAESHEPAPRPDEAERQAADELSRLGQEMRLDEVPYIACWGPDVDQP